MTTVPEVKDSDATVCAVVTRHVWMTFQPDQPVKLILNAMQSTHTGAAGVIDEKSRLVGILTEREILRRVFALFDDPTVSAENLSKHVHALTVRDVMTPQPEVLLDTMDAETALTKMSALGYRYMPIVSHDDPQRMLGIADERELRRHVGSRLAEARSEMAAKDTLLAHFLHEPYGVGYETAPDDGALDVAATLDKSGRH